MNLLTMGPFILALSVNIAGWYEGVSSSLYHSEDNFFEEKKDVI